MNDLLKGWVRIDDGKYAKPSGWIKVVREDGTIESFNHIDDGELEFIIQMNDLLKGWIKVVREDGDGKYAKPSGWIKVREDGTIESFNHIDDELEFIIQTLRSLYASGGSVSKIMIDDNLN